MSLHLLQHPWDAILRRVSLGDQMVEVCPWFANLRRATLLADRK
jgi:hypothetical protein